MNFGWNELSVFAYSALWIWVLSITVSCVAIVLKKEILQKLALYGGMAGTIIIAVYIALYWLAVQRPPLKTLGETRLWYSALLPAVGYLVYYRWNIKWLDPYCTAMAALFLAINIAVPDAHDKTLMPALQSPWFVPHVIVYMVGYALLGGSALVGMKGLYKSFLKTSIDNATDSGQNLVTLGFVFISFGLIFGAFWAKEAWGHYWSWDPKETWALITWLVYLVYLHVTARKTLPVRQESLFLVTSFAVLLMCWFGINYMMAGQASVHTYSG